MRPSHRRAMCAALALAAAAMPAAAANAATTIAYFPPGQSTPPAGDPFGLVIHGDADPTIVNVRMLENPTRFRTAVLRPDNTFAPMTVGPGCTTVTNAAECNEAGTLLATATLGAGNDRISENSLGGSTGIPFFATFDAKGEAGNDNLSGNRGPDKLDGGDGDDTIAGNAGADTLTGGAGRDTITGGDGADTIRGGTGVDTINARDGIKDTLVDCGGTGSKLSVDSLTADLQDAPVNCARFSKFAADDGPPGTVTSTKLRNGDTTTLRLRCPKDAKVRCIGRLTIRDPRSTSRILASMGYDVALGKTGSVTVPLGDSAQSLLRSRGQALLQTVEKGKSKLGPRSTQTLVSVT
jgi:RTX calcium-binding nonapeptide repeat (4 copies)